MSTTTTGPTTAVAGSGGPVHAESLEIPSEKTLVHVAKLSVEYDKPILLDYYNDSKNNQAFVGEDSDTKEKILVKSADEFTSPIQRIFKVGGDYIVMTENSLYVTSGNIKKKMITTGAKSQ